MILQDLTQLLISDINNKMIEFTGSTLNTRELDELSYCSDDETNRFIIASTKRRCNRICSLKLKKRECRNMFPFKNKKNLFIITKTLNYILWTQLLTTLLII